MANVLIIDDDKLICEMLIDYITRIGHVATRAHTLAEGLDIAANSIIDVVFLDMNLPDGSGLQVISGVQSSPGKPEVIIITGAGDADSAEIAILNGAWDYLQKPLSLAEITLPLKRVLQYRENFRESQQAAIALKRDGIIGSSRQLNECLDIVAQAARNDANVLITGETGTGKELFARAVHANSSRAKGNFVVVDCAALPESLKESALFGHAKGAFTGADKAAEGLVHQADGGTLFLDEVGELSPTLQKTFLRVLQERKFRPVGSKTEITSNFRLISATNQKLESLVSDGLFRSDILYRLKTISLELPPLRDHTDDIKEIILFHGIRICKKLLMEEKGFSPGFVNNLCVYNWPGNIRELVNTLEGSISLALNEPILFPKHLPDNIRIQVIRSNVDQKNNNGSQAYTVEKFNQKIRNSEELDLIDSPGEYASSDNSLETREAALEKADIGYIRKLMQFTRGDIKESCKISGLGRTRLYTLLKKYNISRSGWGTENRLRL